MKRIYFSATAPNLDFGVLKKELAGRGMLALLTVILLAGMICGAIATRNSDEAILARLDFLFSSNFQMEGQTMIGIFAASFVSVFLFLLATLWMGMSLWGTVLIPVRPFFRGFGLGVSSGFLYASYGWQGVLFHTVVMLPGMVVSSVAILISAREGMRFSKDLIRASFSSGKKGRGASPALREYLTRNGMILVLGAIAALLDMVLTALLSGVIHLE